MKNIVRLTESELHGIIKESVRKILTEYQVRDIHGNLTSVHGNDKNSWKTVANIRGERALDAWKRKVSAEDEMEKNKHEADVDFNFGEYNRDMKHADDLEKTDWESFDEKYDDDYLRQFMTPYEPDEEETSLDDEEISLDMDKMRDLIDKHNIPQIEVNGQV